MSDYSSIMDHPHHESKTHPHMSMIARSAQFSPFAALTGYDESVAETGRLTEDKITLDDDAIAAINRTLSEIESGRTVVTITYFLPDTLKEGGSYTIFTGEIKKIDPIEERLIMKDGTIIPIEDIFDISIT